MHNKIELLTILQNKVECCTLCSELNPVRIKYVFGNGNPNSKILFLGEGPGSDENKTGEPFCGKSGQLLNKLLELCGIKREDVYVCNILKCRPPDNRKPLPYEVKNCSKFLDAQIKIVNPEYIITLGTTATQNLLKTRDTISKLRGRFYDYKGIKVLPLFHPSYALRTGEETKQEMLKDLQIVVKHMNEII